MENLNEIILVALSLEDEPNQLECAQIMATSEPWITLGRSASGVLQILKQPINETYLIQKENELMGFTIIIMEGAWVGYIRSIVLKPEWRGQGIGSRVIKLLEGKIFTHFPNVFLSVSSFNPLAKKLYLDLGYEEIGELKDYVITGHSEFVMRKSIGSWQDFEPNSY